MSRNAVFGLCAPVQPRSDHSRKPSCGGWRKRASNRRVTSLNDVLLDLCAVMPHRLVVQLRLFDDAQQGGFVVRLPRSLIYKTKLSRHLMCASAVDLQHALGGALRATRQLASASSNESKPLYHHQHNIITSALTHSERITSSLAPYATLGTPWHHQSRCLQHGNPRASAPHRDPTQTHYSSVGMVISPWASPFSTTAT